MISSVICWSRKAGASQPPAIAEEESSVRLSATRSFRRQVGGLLHPERESKVALDELKTSMGTMEFSANISKRRFGWRQSHQVVVVQVLRPAACFLAKRQSHYQLDTASAAASLLTIGVCCVAGSSPINLHPRCLRARLEYPDLKRQYLRTITAGVGRRHLVPSLSRKKGRV